MHSQRRYSSMIMLLCFIVTVCHTTTSSFLVGAILLIGTAIFRLSTCVPREVHYLLIQKKIFSPLQYDSTVNSDPHKYFLDFPMDYLTADAYTTKVCLDFSSGYTVDIDIK